MVKKIQSIVSKRYHDFSFKHVVTVELLFLFFVLLNVVKLTGIQFLMTQDSGFALEKMVMKNIVFLYFSWRLLFLLKQRWIPLLVFLLQGLYLSGHLFYFLYSGNIFNLMQMTLLSEGLRALSSLGTVFATPALLFVVVDIPLMIYIYRNFEQVRERLLFLDIPALGFSFCLLFIVVKKADYFGEADKYWGYTGNNAKYGTIYTSLVLSRTGNEKDVIKKISYGDPIEVVPADQRTNVVVIQVESLNADVVDFENKGTPVMPFLNNLRYESIYYPYMLAQHKAGGSSDAEFSVINSAESLETYPLCKLKTYSYPNSFLHRMDSFEKIAFHGNYGEYFNRATNLANMGFDDYLALNELDLPEEGWGASDGELFQAVLNHDHTSDAFYYHIITMSSHAPFDRVAQYYRNPALEDITNQHEYNYLLSMNYVDKVLGEYIHKQKAEDPSTCFLIYGDHSVGVNGEYYKAANRFMVDGKQLETVPLFIITPEGTSFWEEKNIVSFLDLGSTILSVSGVGGRICSFGSDLSRPEAISPTIIFGEKSYRRQELYNLVNEKAVN